MKQNSLDRLRAMKWGSLLKSKALYERSLKEGLTAEDLPTLIEITTMLYTAIEEIHDVLTEDFYTH